MRYSTWKAEIEEVRDKGSLFLSLKPPQEMGGGLFWVASFLPKLAMSSIQSLYLQTITLTKNRGGLRYWFWKNALDVSVPSNTCNTGTVTGKWKTTLKRRVHTNIYTKLMAQNALIGNLLHSIEMFSNCNTVNTVFIYYIWLQPVISILVLNCPMNQHCCHTWTSIPADYANLLLRSVIKHFFYIQWQRF